ncbi:MAG: IPT/TIG domain-containing protein [Treponema sp.]|jgi:transglutaminase-like putative cysteine protease|nr:IPT/TIG domain-containing protein [Treponema sp.]
MKHEKSFSFSPVLFLLVALSFLACSEKLPVISRIDPRIGQMGEVLTIYGENFGDSQGESYITIAGAPPTGSSYVRWQDDSISVRIPEFSTAGLVYVHRQGRKSNPALFSNKAVIPEPVRGDETGSGPRISSVEPQAGAIGSLVTLYGSSFGTSRENSGLWFSWDAESAPGAPVEAQSPEAVEVFDVEFGYELWSEREIRVRVPDGAASGTIEVRTPRGNSRPVFFEINGKPGTKIIRDKRSYALSYSVDIRTEDALTPNSLYLWLPRPVSSASQRNTRLLSRNTDPFVENYRGSSLYQFIDLMPGTGRQITLSYVTEVYAVETVLRPQGLRLDSSSPVQTVYTQPTPLIPSEDSAISAQAAAITGRERNPYLKAQRIYEWLIKELEIRAEPMAGGALEGLEEKQADSYRAALLFCALARASGIPAIPAAGVLVNRLRGTSRHYWAEFWIDSFGWVPLDPALGAGAAPPDFNLREDHGSYYFGNMDNQRVAFSRGETFLSQMDPRGRTTVRTRDFAFQNLWEEAIGGLESYSSLWSDVTITGVYVQ